MELCIFNSLQDYGSLQKVPELATTEKLQTHQCDCGYFIVIAGAVFYITSEKREISNYGYGTSLVGNYLEELLTTTSIDVRILITLTIILFLIISNEIIINIICSCLLLSVFMRPLRPVQSSLTITRLIIKLTNE